MYSFRRICLYGICLAVGFSNAAAHADFQFEVLLNGAPQAGMPIDVTSASAGQNYYPLSGTYSFSFGPSSKFNVSFNVTAANPAVGSPYDAQIQVQNLTITNGSSFGIGAQGGTVDVLFSSNGNTVVMPPNLASFSAMASGGGYSGFLSPSSNISETAYYASSNTLFDTSGSSQSANLNFNTGNKTFSGIGSSYITPTNPFAVTLDTKVVFNSSTVESANFTTAQTDVTTPEPGSMVLWGLALTGAAGTRLRRRKWFGRLASLGRRASRLPTALALACALCGSLASTRADADTIFSLTPASSTTLPSTLDFNSTSPDVYAIADRFQFNGTPGTTISTVHLWMVNNGGATTPFQFQVFADNGGSGALPNFGNVLGTTGNLADTSGSSAPQEITGTLTSPLTLATGTYYWIGASVIGQTASGPSNSSYSFAEPSGSPAGVLAASFNSDGSSPSTQSSPLMAISVDGIAGPVSTPEPTTLALVGVGAIGLVLNVRARYREATTTASV